MSGLLKYFLSTGLGGVLAFALAIFLRDYPVKRAVPSIFVLVLVLINHLAGRLATLLAAFVAGLTFAVYLFEPYGSLAVWNATDRIVLSCFAVVALVLAYLAPYTKRNPHILSGGAALIERNEHWIALSLALLAVLIGVLVLFG